MQELSDWILPNNSLLFSPQEWLRKTICVAHADHIQWESLECKSPVDSRAFQTSSKRNCYYCPLPALPKCHSILSLVEFVLVSASHSVVSCPLWPHGLCSPWNSPGHNTGVDSLSFSRGSSQLRDGIQVSRIAGGFFTSWATGEAAGTFVLVVYKIPLSLLKSRSRDFTTEIYTIAIYSGYLLSFNWEWLGHFEGYRLFTINWM